jgi:hypothetical protein
LSCPAAELCVRYRDEIANVTISDIRVLEIFNEKVERLDRYSFTRHLRENSVGFTFGGDAEHGYTFQLNGPSEESVDAFALTLRMFLQNNDLCSIQRIDSLYERLSVSEVLRKQFADARAELNRFLDGPSQVILQNERLSNRVILETFLYGLLAHTSPDKRKKIDSWAKDPMRFQILYMVFLGVLTELLAFVLWAHEHNVLALSELRRLDGSQGEGA